MFTTAWISLLQMISEPEHCKQMLNACMGLKWYICKKDDNQTNQAQHTKYR